MKLQLHLIPTSTWEVNLRNFLGPKWTQVSQAIRSKHNHTCIYCSWKERSYPRLGSQWTHAHEVWEFNAEKRTQTLVGIECLCPLCHAIHHWGLSLKQKLNMDELIKQACTVNKCTPEEWKEHVDQSWTEWAERSGTSWAIICNNWESFL